MPTGVFGWLVMSGPAAYASCAAPPDPSPYAFVGRVVATESADRIATVRTTAGKTIQVVGTPSPGDNSVTSVDRTYVVGATYEFHPDNGSEPYEDNICTATTRLLGEAIPATLRDSEASPDEASQSGGDGNASVQAMAGVVVVGVGSAGLWLKRRHGSR